MSRVNMYVKNIKYNNLDMATATQIDDVCVVYVNM